jgi:hypothetical protein
MVFVYYKHLVIIPTFHFGKAAKYRKQGLPTRDIITWEDNIPRSATSVDGIKLVNYLPNLVKSKAVVCINIMLLDIF